MPSSEQSLDYCASIISALVEKLGGEVTLTETEIQAANPVAVTRDPIANVVKLEINRRGL